MRRRKYNFVIIEGWRKKDKEDKHTRNRKSDDRGSYSLHGNCDEPPSGRLRGYGFHAPQRVLREPRR